MSSTIRVVVIGVILLLLDIYFYQAILVIFKGASISKRNIVFYIYWGFTLLTFLVFLSPVVFHFADLPKFVRIYVFAFFGVIILSKLIGAVFIGVDDLIRFFRWIVSFFIKPVSPVISEIAEPSAKISRLTFLNQLAIGLAAIPFAGFIYGMVKGAFDYKVHQHKITLPNLPASFNGLKVVQISDIHSGSFVSSAHLEEAVKIIMDQKADVIFFTGDLVNNEAKEMELFMDVLDKIKAPMGVYSTLGNHDYGDYISWESREAKVKNLEDLKMIHENLGWRLLMNEYIILKKEEDEIAVIGIENWGGNLNFPKYGDMKKAYAGAEHYPVKLLLSHDPSHWKMQVREEYKDIDITFSGHTHGFQFGIEIPGWIKWSPSQFVYKQWAGLYTEENQHLYVNRGLGFLGYPGRVGIMPEITVMELHNC